MVQAAKATIDCFFLDLCPQFFFTPIQHSTYKSCSLNFIFSWRYFCFVLVTAAYCRCSEMNEIGSTLAEIFPIQSVFLEKVLCVGFR